MTLEEKIDALHDAKVINKNAIDDPDKSRIGNLTDDDIERLIAIANKLFPGRQYPAEISLLF